MNRKFILKLSLGLACLSTVSLLSFNIARQSSSQESNLFEIRKNSEIFFDVYKLVDAMYVDQPEPGKLMKIGIDAMLQSLDPYTNYIPESQMEDYRFMTTGQYGGIGATIRKAGDYVMITEPYEGNPAHQAGLMAGDILLEVDGKSIKGKNTEDVSALLKGQPGSKVKVKIEREGNSQLIEFERKEVKLPDVPYYGMIDDEVGYIKLNSFTQTAHRDVDAAFKELKSKNMKKLIFDLRGNGGGLLIESVKIVNMFVPKGEKVVEMRGRLQDLNRTYRTTDAPIDTEMPLVVLVDEGSASASEIVSGSLQDLDRAVIVGNRTFGKGLVQQTHDLKYNGKIKITIAKYYTPSGRCIQKLDYGHKGDDGRAHEVPDSLVTYFKTRNGRSVSDGRGIEPDVLIDERDFSPISAALVREDIIFNFATRFRLKNEKVSEPEQFRIDDVLFKEFREFALTHNFEYRTATMEQMKKWKKAAEAERYLDNAQAEFNALMKKVTPDVQSDLDRFRDQISLLLENEIISRYYFQKGRYRASFHRDDALIKAREILKDVPVYQAILKGNAKR
jgi:carboxyl-terminal processing protease